ncbi:MAG: heme lyase CcmF/NrfE family subunit [Chloroflexi bacterium]|nr:heme lyase CcmF/NrfE family subunit [Chloroflexota bacterium]
MTDIGETSLVVAFFVALYAMVAAALGKALNYHDLVESARRGLLATAALVTLASAALVYAFVTRDFSIQYVYQYSSSDMSLPYTIAAWWAGQAGSLLLWAWVLSMMGVVVLWQNRRQNLTLLPVLLVVITGVLGFFLGLATFVSNPFDRLPFYAAEGEGLNPLLENMGMFFHPTTLYLGYIGFTIPFAFAMAALVTNRLDDQWVRSSRRWTLFAWLFLGLGNLFGAQWAYVELGWGGYMGWDPVENASMMPWLVGTAYLHSVMIQQRRGMLKIWNMALIITTFALSIFGTFLTRSGVLSSVHTFSVGAMGPLFVSFILIVVAVSVGLLWHRLPQLRSEAELDSLVSRESTFLFNNLLLVGAAFAIFWGTVFPLISEAVRGTKITVGPPFYNQVIPPILLALLAIMAVCPIIGWRKASRANLIRNFLRPFIASLAVPAVLLALGVTNGWAVLSSWILVFVVATVLLEFYRGLRARWRGRREDPLRGLMRLVASNKPRYGGLVAHLGFVVMGAGVVASSLFSSSVEGTLRPGDSLTIEDYQVTYGGLNQYQTASKQVVSASLNISRGGTFLQPMQAEKYYHRSHDNPVTEVGLRSTLMEDLYVILAGWGNDGSATLKILVNPLVTWIWLGGGVLLFGTVVAMWPDRRERDRLVRREQRLVESEVARVGS